MEECNVSSAYLEVELSYGQLLNEFGFNGIDLSLKISGQL